MALTRAAVTAVILAALLLRANVLSAQAPIGVWVRLLAEDDAPIAGATIRAVDAAGDTVAGQVTGTQGNARLLLPRPGQYQFVVHHIRYEQWNSGPRQVDESSGTLEFRIAERALPIDEIAVIGERRCDTPPEEGAAILRMYELMQVALGKVIEGEQGRTFTVRETREPLRGMDVIRGPPDSVYSRARPTTTPDASFVTTYGWVDRRIGYSDHAVYHVPVPDVLTSDQFRKGHCFRTAGHPDSAWSGLRFEPMKGSPLSPDRGDVRGTVWIDTIRSMPIRVDFEYAELNSVVVRSDGPAIVQRLREVLRKIADGLQSQGLYALASVYRISPHPTYAHLRDRDYGGHVLFEEMDGSLVTARWEIVYPVLQYYLTHFAETMGGRPVRYRLTGTVLGVTGR